MYGYPSLVLSHMHKTGPPFPFRFPFSWRVTELPVGTTPPHSPKIFKKKRIRSAFQDDPDGRIEPSRQAPPYLLWPPTAHVSTPIEPSSSSTQQRCCPSIPPPPRPMPRRANARRGARRRPPDLDNAGSRHHDSIETLARLARCRLQEPTGWAAAGREDGGAGKRQGDASVFEPRVSAETFVLSFSLLLTGDMRAAASPLFWGCFVADRNKQHDKKSPDQSTSR